ncbi:phosphoenolpyruvate--protein phosphotransferase [Shewanella cyperi]|uniref:phosphoenolpyruvate--protein phosphotransferase n=1 Tax=Shewanella cyperi TaxID=2814292 RepID=UPI001A93BCB3|nr:phosphoenolpyruvate--protein phosphotransferase [Shewanella cyperi]QSX39292.1 phosphoenolpyruvate--protein phosphotransferase [Shewanella cyperi]
MDVKGIAVSSGISFGEALHLATEQRNLDYRLLPLSRIPQQLNRFDAGLKRLTQQLADSLQGLDEHSDNYQLIEADLLLLEDPEMAGQIRNSIRGLQFSAAVAIERVFAHQASELEAMDDPYLAHRAQDVRCLGRRLIAAVDGKAALEPGKLTRPTIILAPDLTPAEFAVLPLDNISGLVLKSGGYTSHTAILARAAGLPALLSCNFDSLNIANGDALVLDAEQGCLHHQPDAELLEQLNARAKAEAERRVRLEKYRERAAMTKDGHEVSLLANVGNLNDITHLAKTGVDGIGLFRTEFMLMHCSELPDERSQYRLYCDALHALEGQVFTIRTMDIGADKELPCLPLTSEDNPALGLRGLRYSLAHPEMLKTQLRAVLRAANHGHIRLMFPMVNQVEELDRVFALLEECKQELIEEERGFGELSLGIVIETPAAVMNLPSMLPMLDFVSIGTNDLTQYAMAADRANPQLTRDYPTLSPAILRLISMILQSARAQNVRVSLCGELGSDPRLVPLLIGLGLDELSVNTGMALEVKAAICEADYQRCLLLAGQALMADRLEQLNQCITNYK